MLNDVTLRELLARRTELKNLDYKLSMDWSSATNDAKCELVKDILAMMNTQDGGQIVIGVQDETCEPVGVSDGDFTSFDPTKVNDFLHKYTDPVASCQVQKLSLDGKNFVVIDVPEFADVPIICKADANSVANRSILKRGAMYVRTGKPTSEMVSSTEDMRDLMNRALLKRGDQLLRTIQALILGRTAVPANDLDAYQEELHEAEGFFSKTLPEDVATKGYWELIALPNTYVNERADSFGTLAHVLTESEVSLRGWNFPHIDRERAANFSRGRQSSTIWDEVQVRHNEALRAYISGAFLWRGAYWEDAPAYGRPGTTLSFVNIIFQITEFFLFLSRYYARIADEASLRVTIRLTKTKGRQLVSLDAGPLFDNYVCLEDKIEIIGEYSVSLLRASAEEIARRVIKRVFEIFQWTTARDEMIQQRQRQLLERRF